jgi:hypothetical protein
MKRGIPPLPLLKVLAHLDRLLAGAEKSLSHWPLAGLLLLILASVLTLTALACPRAGAVLPGVGGTANIPPPDVTAPADLVQTDTPESRFSFLARREFPDSGFNPATSLPPLNTPPLAVEESHDQPKDPG